MRDDATANDQDGSTPAGTVYADPGSISHMMNLFASSGHSTATASTSSNSNTSESPSRESSPLLEGNDEFDSNAAPVAGLRSSYRG